MPSIETAELVGGPWDGGHVQVERSQCEARIWWRAGESIDVDATGADRVVLIALKYPTRHRYRRTDRRTAGGATVFRHCGREAGVFA